MKRCFKCNKDKDINDFYKHNMMSDGHLGKCKECTKQDVKNRYYNPKYRQKIKEYERSRFKNPERKKNIAKYQKKRRHSNPQKYRNYKRLLGKIKSGAILKLPCEKCGDKKTQAHHDDYSHPFNVRWLCFKHHRELHGQIID